MGSRRTGPESRQRLKRPYRRAKPRVTWQLEPEAACSTGRICVEEPYWCKILAIVRIGSALRVARVELKGVVRVVE